MVKYKILNYNWHDGKDDAYILEDSFAGDLSCVPKARIKDAKEFYEESEKTIESCITSFGYKFEKIGESEKFPRKPVKRKVEKPSGKKRNTKKGKK